MKLKHQPQKFSKRRENNNFLIKRGAFLLSLVLFMALEGGGLRLAYWQYNRMQEKEGLREAAEAARQLDVTFPLEIDDIGRKIGISGQFMTEKTHLLEHQRHQTGAGEVAGWRVVTPFVTAQGVFLVDRGWTPYLKGEGRLNPDFSVYQPLEEKVTIEGVLQKLPERKQGGWGGATYATNPRVLLFLDGAYIEPKSEPYYIQAKSMTSTLIEPTLPPLPSSAKHIEYMWTWLLLALIFPCLYVTAVWQRVRRTPKGDK